MRTNTNRLRIIATASILAMTLAACGGGAAADETTTTFPDTTTTAPPTTTAPDTTTTEPPATTQPDTITPSDEAQATLDEIRAAAEAGDLQRLAELALSSDVLFTASFGQEFSDPTELAGFWASIEDPTIPEVILGLLDAGYHQTMASYEDGTQVPISVTPAVMGEGSTDADRERLDAIFGEETVSGWFGDGMYLGWRMGVDADGNWRFLVFGD